MFPLHYDEKISKNIGELKKLILDNHKKINKIKMADPEKKQMMIQMLSEYKTLRGKDFFFKMFASGRGHGPFIELVDGSIKYDLINSIGVNLLGHSHPTYIDACLEAATNDTIMVGNLLTYGPPYLLTKTLLQYLKNTRLKHLWFSCSGSFANDIALKILWQKKAPNYRIISFKNSFAGRSVAMQDVSDDDSCREGMPKSVLVDHVPHFDHSNPKKSLRNTLNALDDLIARNGNIYCAISMEIIQGEAGFVYGDREYYLEIFKWAKTNNLYIWIDEVQTFGRTSELFAFQMFELDEYVDVVTVGKTLQACVTIYSDELNPKPGLIAGTYNGSITTLTAGKNILDYLLSKNIYGKNGKIKQLEELFCLGLNNLAQTSCKGLINNIRCLGTMISFEVFNGDHKKTLNFLELLFENGIIAFYGGKEPTRIRMLLSVVLTHKQIDEIFLILEESLIQFSNKNSV